MDDLGRRKGMELPDEPNPNVIPEGSPARASNKRTRSLVDRFLPFGLRSAACDGHESPWVLGGCFGLATFLLFQLTRIGMALTAVPHGYTRGLGAPHLLWVLPTLAYDMVVALTMGFLTGLMFRVLLRLRRLAFVLAYALILTVSLVCLVSVPTYGALQTTLQLTQLMLAGGAQDIFESGLEVVTPLGAVAGTLALLGSLSLVPRFTPLSRRVVEALASRGTYVIGLPFVAVVALTCWQAPEDGAAGLEVNPVGEFVLSAARYVLRQHDEAHLDMRGAPHFNNSLIRGKAPLVEPLEKLVATSKLPLEQPNVIFAVLESASVKQLELWEGKAPTTPRLRELQRHALIFDAYYTATPVSMKSLFSLSCSSYPLPLPQAETYVNPSIDCVSISEILKAHGYRTGLFHAGRFSYTRKDQFFRHRKLDVMRDAERLQHAGKYKKVSWGADDRALIDDALAWLEQGNLDQPFFLDLIFLAPHHPYSLHDAPTPFGVKNDLERYRNATLLIDSQVGRVWDWLVAHGKAENTLLVVVGDHGEAFGEHRRHYTHGTRIYDEVMRTPLMLVNPQLFSGQRTARIGNHVDLVPTVLDLLGLPSEPRHQGKSLLRGYRPHVVYFYADWYRHYLGLRDGHWKYIYDVDADKAELYDLSRDPGERKNLAASHPANLEAYHERVMKWEAFYRELIPNYEHYVNGGAACPGRDICYLDELKPTLQHGKLRLNKSLNGRALEVGTRKATRGLGVAPLSILRYNLFNQAFKRLRGAVGHHVQGGKTNLSLRVSTEIYLDDRLIWSSGKLAADEEPREFDLDIEGGAVLELITYDVDGEDWRDYTDWLDVRLER